MYSSTLSEPEVTFTSSGRPKYKKLRLSPAENILNSFGILFNLALWIIFLIKIPKLQSRIPFHAREDGSTDTYVSSFMLLLLPALGTIIFIILFILTLYPHVLVLRRVRLTVENGAGIYMLTRGYYRAISLVTQILLFVAGMIWLKKAFDDQVPGLAVLLIPTVGFVVGTLFLTLIYNSLIQEEAKVLLNKHEIYED